MRHRTNTCHRRRIKTSQLELFAPVVRPAVALTPQWQTLPAEARETLTALLVRLLLEHAQGACQADPAEAHAND